MNDSLFDELEALKNTDGAIAVVNGLIDVLEQRKDYHRLFDALLLKKRLEMGLPLPRPTAFEDVPEDRQQEFEDHYVACARNIGEKLLAENNLQQAWLYFRTIREPGKIADALETLDVEQLPSDSVEELIGIALYDGAHPVKGLELMLASRGTCNTITAFDQHLQQMAPEVRQSAAALLVRHLHSDLVGSVNREIERKEGKAADSSSLCELMRNRDWLFDDGNYHIDVSHLSSVVRFARFLKPGAPDLLLALELAEYGSHLSPQFQYAAEPPFDEYYAAHIRFFQVLADQGREEALAWFQARLRGASENVQDRQIIAYVLTDLLSRIDRWDEAVEIAATHLMDVDEASGFSMARLCVSAGREDVLRKVARQRGDVITFAAALLNDSHRSKDA